MLCLRVEYLLGKAFAATDDRKEAEWPPHPIRLFAAMVSVLHESLGNDGRYRQALEWLEEQGAPEIVVTEGEKPPSSVGVYVPVPDDSRWLEGERRNPPISADIPFGRKRALRYFPYTVPRDPTVYFVWKEAEPPPDVVESLSDLAARVSYLGHSSSLVAVAVAQDAPPSTLVPCPAPGELVLRVPSAGLLKKLENEYYPLQKDSRFRSIRMPHRRQPYGPSRPRPSVARPTGSSFRRPIVLAQKGGPRLPLTSSYGLSRAFRSAWMSACASEGIPLSEILTGHAPDGGPAQRPHLALVPLPFVGDPERELYADGHLMGLAVVPPATLTQDDEMFLGLALRVFEDKEFHVHLGKTGTLVFSTALRSSKKALDVRTWCAASRKWASVTPVVLDRFPKKGGIYGEEAMRVVSHACARIGLPQPSEVQLLPVSVFRGAPPSREFPPLKHGSCRRLHVHAIVEFPNEVKGPVLLGAGRYSGMGLLRPLGVG